MKWSQFEKIRDNTLKEIRELNQTKGRDYAGAEDAFNNFKTNAKRTGLTVFQVWSIYFLKHENALETFIRDGKVQSEPIEGRINDMILYLLLLRGMIEEEK